MGVPPESLFSVVQPLLRMKDITWQSWTLRDRPVSSSRQPKISLLQVVRHPDICGNLDPRYCTCFYEKDGRWINLRNVYFYLILDC